MMISGATPGVTWRDEVSREEKFGTVLNSAYCPVSGKWFMLVMEDAGRFHNIPADGLETFPLWVYDVVHTEEDDGESDDE